MDETASLRQALVEGLERNKWITDPKVRAAFLAVPRHLFLPGVPVAEAYADKAIVTKMVEGHPVSSSSQPGIMAVMLEQLELGAGDKVLEIGAGTGYNAALMSCLVGAQGRVTSVEIDADTTAFARENLERAEALQVEVIHGDGGFGYPPSAPYDAVIATVGAWDISPNWFDQIRDRGRLVAPLSFHSLQFSIAFEKIDGRLVSRSIRPCGFMRLRGEYAGPDTSLEVLGLTASFEPSNDIRADALRGLLEHPPRTLASSHVKLTESRALIDYLALRGEPLVSLFDPGGGKLECEFGVGLMSGSSSLLVLTFDSSEWGLSPAIRIYGDDSALIRLEKDAAEWMASGQPDLSSAAITALPIDSFPDRTDGFVVRKKWMEYWIDFGQSAATAQPNRTC
jgi:methyltransferase of FxLD system